MLQRFVLGSAAKATYLPDPETVRNGLKTDALNPASSAAPAIQLPADHYAHPGAPTE